MLIISAIITILLFVAFFISYKKNKTRIITGFLFGLFFISAFLTYTILTFYFSGSLIFLIPFLIFAAIGLIILLFGLYFIAAYLLLSAYKIFKKERHSLGNSLALLAGVGIIVLSVISSLIGSHAYPKWLESIWSGIYFVICLYAFHVLLFLTTLTLCSLAKPHKNQDYIIVLGSGIINGKVTPLLAGRIDKAISFAQKQKLQADKDVTLLMSGGKGSDESRAEGEAMKEYALDKGYPQKFIIAETESANTQENFIFSKKIMDQFHPDSSYNCIFSTSNYHLLRSGIYARKAGLNIDGIGSKTASYYLPNALLREYIAFIAMHKKGFLLTAVIAFSIVFLLNLFTRIYT